MLLTKEKRTTVVQIAIFTPLSAYQECQSACRLVLPLLLILPIGAA